MKVAELKDILKKYDNKSLSEISVELYKKIPKKVREENGIDEMLADFNNRKRPTGKREAPVDFEVLRKEILQFADYAEAQFYFAPNQYVHKKERPKWRFITKRYIKTLVGITGEHADEAADLLILLYRMLSYACHYYIFNTDDPFASVGYEQDELLDIVIAKNFHHGFSRDRIRKAVALTIESEVNRYTLHIELLFVLIRRLKTSEAREIAAEECMAYKMEDGAGKGFIEDGCFRLAKDSFTLEEMENNTVGLYFHLKIMLYEYDEAIDYYHKNYHRDGGKGKSGRRYGGNEITLYILLGWLEMHGLTELWRAEYEKALKQGIDPRESLQDTYRKLRNGLSFDEIQ
ncbi:MAG: hypothetical protein LBL54_01355 [Clostridiales Family XIII bacterium]|jgi:hypothetical protein|nr:hypothetical protein [Clostridiales Family XIII bacterium]